MDERRFKGNLPEGSEEGLSFEDLRKNPLFKSISEYDWLFIECLSISQPEIKNEITKIIGLRGEKQTAAFNQFRIKTGELQETAIANFIKTSRRFTVAEKDILQRNYRRQFFWELLIIAFLLKTAPRPLLQKVVPGEEIKYTEDLAVTCIKDHLRQWKRRQEYTLQPALKEADYSRFVALLMSVVTRLTEARDADQAVYILANEACPMELIQVVQRLPQDEVLRLLNRLYRNPEFSKVRTGIFRLKNYFFPRRLPPDKRTG